MQAMAPGKSADLQAGQRAGCSAPVGVSRSLADSVRVAPRFPTGAAATAAASGAGAGAPLTTNTFLHPGQRTDFPLTWSGTWSSCWQCEHLMTNGMRGLDS